MIWVFKPKNQTSTILETFFFSGGFQVADHTESWRLLAFIADMNELSTKTYVTREDIF